MGRGADRRVLGFVIAVVLVDSIGFGIVMPVLPGIVMRIGRLDMAGATRVGGWLALVYALVQFVSGPTVGNLGDRFGRRPVVLGSLAGFAVDYLLLGFAPSLGWLFAGRALAGLFGVSFGPAGAALADISAPENRARFFGYMGAAFGVGFVIGPAIGGLLGELGPRAPFHVAALLALANLLFGLFFFPETLPRARRRAFSWRRANPLGALVSLARVPGVLPVAAVGFWWNLAGLVYPVTWSFFAILRYGWSPGLIGLSLTLAGVSIALGQVLLVGRVVARVGEARAAAIGIGVTLVGFLGYAAATETWMVFAVMLVTPAQSLVLPALTGLMSRAVPADAQGELQGFNGSVYAIGEMVAPLVYSPALAFFGGEGAPVRVPGIAFLLAALAAGVALVLLLRLDRRLQTPSATPS